MASRGMEARQGQDAPAPPRAHGAIGRARRQWRQSPSQFFAAVSFWLAQPFWLPRSSEGRVQPVVHPDIR